MDSATSPRYSKDAPFDDPIVRCDSCSTIIKTAQLRKLGMCPDCGNRRVKNVLIMKPEEFEKVKAWNLDPDFMALFHEVDDGNE